jgi:hypothetical protein
VAALPRHNSVSRRKTVIAAWTGIQKRWSGAAVPGCITAKDEGGDASH